MFPALTPSSRAQAVTLRTYCRPLDAAGTAFEDWPSVIHRSTYEHHLRLWEEAGGVPNRDELHELEQLGLSRQGLVSGRTLWLGGTDYAYSRACCNFNCSGTLVSTVYDLVDACWLLLNGCGVGFKPRAGTLHGFLRPISELRVIPSTRSAEYRGRPENQEDLASSLNDYTWTIRVGDSAEAWAKAVGKLFDQRAREVRTLVLDFSEVRGPGGRLKGYGWICNGFKPLAEAMGGMFRVLNAKAGGLLDELDIMDVVNLFGQVLSSRRAAEACEPDWSSPNRLEFLEAKRDYWRDHPWRRQSNNSFQFWSKPTRKEILELLRAADECGGDPGFVNAEAAKRKCVWFELFNPCQPAWAPIVTSSGLTTLEHVQVGTTIWTETGWARVTAKWSTGVKPVFRYRTSSGVFYGTENHRLVCGGEKVEAKDAEGVDVLAGPDWGCTHRECDPRTILDGLVLGDGTRHITSRDKIMLCVGEHDQDYFESEVAPYILGRHPAGPLMYKVDTTLTTDDLPCMWDRVIPSWVMQSSPPQVILGFLRGLFSANGSVVNTRVTLKSTSKMLVEQVQVLLSSVGIRSYFTTNKAQSVEFDNGVFACRESYDVNIQADADKFLHRIGFLQKYKEEKLRQALAAKTKTNGGRLTYALHEPEYVGDHEVFDITVDNDPHTYWTGGLNVSNCFEIALGNHGFCNLVSAAPPLFKRDFAALERAIHLLARANYRQTCIDLQDGVLQPAWHQTNESLRLCGLSLTGLTQSTWLTDYQIRRLRNAAVVGAYSMADELGLPRPKAITTIKPEGTRTKISGTLELGELREGVHNPLGRRIFNWVNYSIHDPLVALLEASGHRVMENPSDANNVLVCHPLDYGPSGFTSVGGREVNLEPALHQLDRYLRWNNLWADHNVSCTVSYSPEELPEVAEWVDRNWDQGFVAVCFLRRNDPTKTARDLGHPYLPQEVVTEEAFTEYTRRLKPLDLSKLSGGVFDLPETSDCASGVCPVR